MTESERIQRFEAAYNRIDHALGDMVASGGDRRKTGFAAKVRIAAARRRHLARYKDFLLEAGELRNALVHSRTGDDEYIAVPSEKTVIEMERVEQAAFSPEKVLPRFARRVIALRSDQSIADAWQLMRDDGYSRYPVYAADGTFVGLLTSNGFARFAAGHLSGTVLHIDTARVHVEDMLDQDHRRDQVIFVSRDAIIDEVDEMFHQNKMLDCVIVTDHGRPDEKPLGLISGNDIAAMSK